jgi:hypothetical protein
MYMRVTRMLSRLTEFRSRRRPHQARPGRPTAVARSTMRAIDLLLGLGDVLNGHRWDELPALLHPDFTGHYVHTGEEFGPDDFVRLNAEYPGFDTFRWEDTVDAGDRAVGRGLVTGTANGQGEQFAVATFVTERDGLIAELTEVWADIDQTPPGDRRPE